jgi:hypothetical protein
MMHPLAASAVIGAIGLALVTALAAHDLRASHQPAEHSVRGVGLLVTSVAVIAGAIAAVMAALTI